MNLQTLLILTFEQHRGIIIATHLSVRQQSQSVPAVLIDFFHE